MYIYVNIYTDMISICIYMRCVAVWSGVLRCDAVCCRVLLSIAVCCSVLQCVFSGLPFFAVCGVLSLCHCALCCGVL